MPSSLHIRTRKTCTTGTRLLTYLFAWRRANNLSDVEMENTSNLNQFRPYFRVLDRDDDYLDQSVM